MSVSGRSADSARPALVMFCVITAVAASLYWLLAVRGGIMHGTAEYLLDAPDAWSYRTVADWLCGASARVPTATLIRPLGYPLLLAAIRAMTPSATAILIAHFLLWVASVNLVAAAARRLTARSFWGYAAGAAMTANVSLILISWRMLSETCAVCVLSAWVYLVARVDFSEIRGWKMFAVVVPLAVATVIRPVFLLPFVVIAGAAAVRYAQRWRILPWIAAAALPVALQMVFMVSVNHVPAVSVIGTLTFRNYYIRQILEKPGVVDREGMRSSMASNSSAANLSTLRFLARNWREAVACYYDNLIAGAVLQSSHDAPIHSRRSLVIRGHNRAYALMHILMVPLALWASMVFRDQTQRKMLMVFLVFAYVMASCGITADLSDRLTLSALPLWLVLYSVTASRMSARLRAVVSRAWMSLPTPLYRRVQP